MTIGNIRSGVWLDRHRSQTLLIIACLLIGAAVLRMPDLGSMGFYGDEETTALVSESIADGHGFAMPSGMPYFRSAPLLAVNAAASKIFGADDEFSYRILAALLGVLTPALIFLASRRLVPTIVALIAAGLLVVSDWHVVTSREARMYGPFLLCFATTALLTWRWLPILSFARSAALAALISLTLAIHSLGLLLAIFPIIWLLVDEKRAPQWRKAAFLAAMPCIFYLVYNELVVLSAYSDWKIEVGTALSTSDPEPGMPKSFGFSGPALAWALPGIVIGAISTWLATRTRGDTTFHWVVDSTGKIVLGGLCTAGHFYAAALVGASLLLIKPLAERRDNRNDGLLLIAIGVVGIFHLVYTHGGLPPFSDIKSAFLFPYPYFLYFWQYSPGLLVVFALGVATLACTRSRFPEQGVRGAALAAIGIVAAIGVASRWGGA